ncbi:MAG: GNAT family protein [Thermaerobacterales bacterium]
MPQETVLIGEQVRLRTLVEVDLTLLRQWDQDHSINELVGKKFGSENCPRSWLHDLHRSPWRVGLAIEAQSRLIGDLELEDINWRARTAELRICIGRKPSWGKGYGTEAVGLAVDYAFSVLDLDLIYLRVNLSNWRAIRCYQKCGFVTEGLLKASPRQVDGRGTMALMVRNRYNKKNCCDDRR